jgi:hypothetical protein
MGALALLSPLIGILGSLLPSIVQIFQRKQELQHEIQLTQIKLDAARQQAQFDMAVESIKADAIEGQSLRDHDKSLDGGKFINALRASIRPVITYLFFILFVAVKVSAAYVMIKNGQSIPDMLKAVWDSETMSLFATIIAFWFGSRVMDKWDNRMITARNISITPIMPDNISSGPTYANKVIKKPAGPEQGSGG